MFAIHALETEAAAQLGYVTEILWGGRETENVTKCCPSCAGASMKLRLQTC